MTSSFPVLRYTYALRIFGLLLFTFLGLLVGGILMAVVTIGGITTVSLRIATVVQDLCIFIIPAVAIAVVVSDRPDRLLGVARGIEPRLLLLSVVAMTCSIPAMNALVAWNEGITLPPSMAGVDAWMRQAEANARESVELLLGGTSVASLIVSVLIVGVLAGFSEELFFRGALQRLLASGRMNPHVAIWTTAFVFSLFHMQFFGFFPRLLLGAFFGYLLLWSGSLWLPVLIHALNNSMVVITSWQLRIDPLSAVGELDGLGTGSPLMIAVSVALTALALAGIAFLSSRQAR